LADKELVKSGIFQDKSRSSRYWLRLLAFFAATLTIALLSTPILLGALFTLGLVYAPCGDNGLTPADYGYPGEATTLQARAGGSFKAYFIPGKNGATIIMPPAYISGLSGRLPEAVMLARHGYAVFLFESRRCAGMGPLSLGYLEVDEVADALVYLSGRPDVNPTKIGVYGFSSAGATAIMAAARFPQIRAVVAEGGYGDFVDDTMGNEPEGSLRTYFFRLYHWSAQSTYRLIFGLDMRRLSPVAVIGQITPRPILLIYGSREVSLPGGRQQLAAAGDNAQLWVVEGAGHGNYLAVAPTAYETRVTAFFNKALLGTEN
jgi:pimeloyl-ACP methyl ester carboxylesterase